jgi:hypothetical protein
MPEPPTSNRQVEDIAVQFVLAREHQAGRSAADVRGKHALVDIEGDLLIEVKAFSGSARGSDLWLETRQVRAALDNPERFHLVIVDNVATGAPHLRDISGPTLTALLARRREKHYFEVPLPTSTYDSLASK